MTLATISFDISDFAGVDFDPRRTKVYATNNVPGGAVIDVDGNHIYLGSGQGEVNADGTGSIEVPEVGDPGYNPASWQTTIHFDYPDRNASRGRTVKSFGPFTITADADLADLVAEMPVQPEYASDVLDRLDALEAGGGTSTDHGDQSGSLTIGGGSHELDLTGDLTVTVTGNADATLWVHGEGEVTVAGEVFDLTGDPDPAIILVVSSPRGEQSAFMAGGSGTPAEPTEVTPGAVTFNDTGNVTTVPFTTGVQYKRNGVNITTAPTSPEPAGLVTYTAVAKAGYVLASGATTSWAHTYPTPPGWSTWTLATFTAADGTNLSAYTTPEGKGFYAASGDPQIYGNRIKCGQGTTSTGGVEFNISEIPAGRNRFSIDADLSDAPDNNFNPWVEQVIVGTTGGFGIRVSRSGGGTVSITTNGPYQDTGFEMVDTIEPTAAATVGDGIGTLMVDIDPVAKTAKWYWDGTLIVTRDGSNWKYNGNPQSMNTTYSIIKLGGKNAAVDNHKVEVYS